MTWVIAFELASSIEQMVNATMTSSVLFLSFIYFWIGTCGGRPQPQTLFATSANKKQYQKLQIRVCSRIQSRQAQRTASVLAVTSRAKNYTRTWNISKLRFFAVNTLDFALQHKSKHSLGNFVLVPFAWFKTVGTWFETVGTCQWTVELRVTASPRWWLFEINAALQENADLEESY